MGFGWSKTNYSPIAVDFGADSVKLLQVVNSDPPQLVAAAMAVLPDEARTNPGARHVFFANAIRDLLKKAPFRGRSAVCSIPAYQTLVQHIQIQRIEQEDFAAQIGLQLRQRLNVDASRMVIRHFEVAEVIRDNTPKQEVICMAASRESVMQHMQTAQKAKLDVVGMHCEPVAILRAFEHLYRGDTSRTTCFIDLGAATSKVIIAHGSQMVFAKTIHAAGDHFNRHRAKLDNLSFLEAREARIREAAVTEEVSTVAPTTVHETAPASKPADSAGSAGLAMMAARIAAERGAAAPQPARAAEPNMSPAMQETLDCLVEELQLCVRYHQTIFPGRNIEKLVFLGGESRNTWLCQRIARSLRIGAQLGDPLARLVKLAGPSVVEGVDFRLSQPGWAVPMGLCLSEAAA